MPGWKRQGSMVDHIKTTICDASYLTTDMLACLSIDMAGSTLSLKNGI